MMAGYYDSFLYYSIVPSGEVQSDAAVVIVQLRPHRAPRGCSLAPSPGLETPITPVTLGSPFWTETFPQTSCRATTALNPTRRFLRLTQRPSRTPSRFDQ